MGIVYTNMERKKKVWPIHYNGTCMFLGLAHIMLQILPIILFGNSPIPIMLTLYSNNKRERYEFVQCAWAGVFRIPSGGKSLILSGSSFGLHHARFVGYRIEFERPDLKSLQNSFTDYSYYQKRMLYSVSSMKYTLNEKEVPNRMGNRAGHAYADLQFGGKFSGMHR